MAGMNLEERVAALEAEVAHLKNQIDGRENRKSGWQAMVGAFLNDPYFEKAMKYGRQYRESLRRKIRPNGNGLMVILDTDHMTLLERIGIPAAQRLEARLKQVPADEICSTVVNFEEQMRGWMAVLAAGRKLKDQIEIYHRLTKQLSIYCSLTILNFDEMAAVEFARLKKEKPRLGVMDLKIAAIALSRKATLLSRNRRDFEQIAGLKLEDWVA